MSQTSDLSLMGLIKLGSTMKSLGVQLSPDNYLKALNAWGLKAPEGFFHFLNEQFYDSLDSSPVLTHVPQKVQKVQVKVSKPVAPTPQLDASDLFDL